jgi:PKHD-type hydroxylase
MIHHKYWIFKSALSKEKCEEIINIGIKNLDKATVGGENEKHNNPNNIPSDTLTRKEIVDKKLSTYVRDSEVSWLDIPWIYEMLISFVHKANNNAGWKFDIEQHETPQFTKYSEKGFYGWHQDGLGDHMSSYQPYIRGITSTPLRKDGGLPAGYTQLHKNYFKVRKLSLTINLTDPNTYEGGDLMFDLGENGGSKFSVTEAREQGSVIVFPSFLYHCVSPVTKGTRYSLVNWILGKPFK